MLSYPLGLFKDTAVYMHLSVQFVANLYFESISFFPTHAPWFREKETLNCLKMSYFKNFWFMSSKVLFFSLCMCVFKVLRILEGHSSACLVILKQDKKKFYQKH